MSARVLEVRATSTDSAEVVLQHAGKTMVVVLRLVDRELGLLDGLDEMQVAFGNDLEGYVDVARQVRGVLACARD